MSAVSQINMTFNDIKDLLKSFGFTHDNSLNVFILLDMYGRATVSPAGEPKTFVYLEKLSRDVFNVTIL